MLIDFTPVKGMADTYTANPGGAPANVAVSAARNGIEAGFLGKLGNDDFGRMLAGTLKRDKVRLLVPKLTDEATTTMAFVTLDPAGERSFTFARKPGADLLLDEGDVDGVDFSEWDIVHAGSVSQSGAPSRDAVLKALKKAKEAGKLVSFDINYRDKIWGIDECRRESEKIYPLADLMKISEEELGFTGGEEKIPAFMRSYKITVLALTMGGDGARIYYNAPGGADVVSEDIKAMNTEAVDTTGAGDAYWGGFLSSLLLQGVKSVSDITMEKLLAAGRYGAAAGGLCVKKSGGIPSLPYREDIEKITGERM